MGTTKKLNIKIKSLNISGAWKYDFPQNTNDSCQICRKHIMAPSYEDITKKETISKISIGKCGHAYHSSCINKYCKTNVSCPIDFTPWELSKELESTKIFFKPRGEVEKVISNNTNKTNNNTNNNINNPNSTVLPNKISIIAPTLAFDVNKPINNNGISVIPNLNSIFAKNNISYDISNNNIINNNNIIVNENNGKQYNFLDKMIPKNEIVNIQKKIINPEDEEN